MRPMPALSPPVPPSRTTSAVGRVLGSALACLAFAASNPSAEELELVTGLLIATHALMGALFLGGLLGRWIVLGLAERADSLLSMQLLTRTAAPFERIVIVGSMVVLVLGVLLAIAQGRPFLGLF
jgi:hypothetical protein